MDPNAAVYFSNRVEPPRLRPMPRWPTCWTRCMAPLWPLCQHRCHGQRRWIDNWCIYAWNSVISILICIPRCLYMSMNAIMNYPLLSIIHKLDTDGNSRASISGCQGPPCDAPRAESFSRCSHVAPTSWLAIEVNWMAVITFNNQLITLTKAI